MLREEDIRIDVIRTSRTGDFLRVVHAVRDAKVSVPAMSATEFSQIPLHRARSGILENSSAHVMRLDDRELADAQNVLE
jgi:hypothetical protein